MKIIYFIFPVVILLGFFLFPVIHHGAHPVFCADLNEETTNEVVVSLARDFSNEGFFRVERSLPSSEGKRPNIGLYQLNGTKFYITGRSITRNETVWPPGVSFYDIEQKSEELAAYTMCFLALLDHYDVEVTEACDNSNSFEYTNQKIAEWREAKADGSTVSDWCTGSDS